MNELLVIIAIVKHFSTSALGGVFVVATLLVLSALASASETAYFSLNPIQIKEIKSKRKGKNNLIIKLLEKPKRLLATILIFNNMVNIAIVIITTFIVNQIFDFTGFEILSFIIQVVVITSLIIFIGEILPKVYAVHNSTTLVSLLAVPLNILVRLLYPLSSLMVSFSSVIDKRISHKNYDITMSYLSDAIDITSDENTPEQEKKILKGIVTFGDIEVKEIMKPRLELTAIDIDTDYHEVLKIIRESGYSRIPAYHETLDNIAGILYIKDLLNHLGQPHDFTWKELLRPAFFIPENKKIDDLLQEFREKKIHVAIVVDEYGGTSGICTLEEIIEEIVGEINDEYDSENNEIVKISDNTYILEGKTSINDFSKLINIDGKIFDPVKGEADTLAGMIIELTGKIPEKSEIVIFNRFTFKIDARDDRRIKKIKVIINPDDKS